MRPRRVRCRASARRVPNENRITDSEIFAPDFRLHVDGDADFGVCIFCIGIGSPTVQDVARRANVCVGFVSRVLNGRDNVAPRIHKAVTH
ncbi:MULTISPECIES: LacI family DNA-binding transcriptional regulator [unclassified Caballeronia]|uniref:LacI family DNA-binding transcriptional regulator n=1 Tax=unclassified Caballeronia TaxID=2646786 RepID=UPI00202921B1|nr:MULTISPECIES: LacI family DNA-binding transcriptional regulator [unclassified Caballeronia]